LTEGREACLRTFSERRSALGLNTVRVRKKPALRTRGLPLYRRDISIAIKSANQAELPKEKARRKRRLKHGGTRVRQELGEAELLASERARTCWRWAKP
jgi:hypothetical protein